MKNLSRIILTAFVLVGSTATFGYWSINQFEQTIDNLGASYLAITPLVQPSPKREPEVAVATSSPEIYKKLTTSIDYEDYEVATSSPEFSFIFPQEEDEVYIGCTYKMSWQSSVDIESLSIDLVDAGTRIPVEATSAWINVVDEGMKLEGLEWEVKNVLPGEYYIKASDINEIDIEAIRSEVFLVREKVQDASVGEDVCGVVDDL